MDKKVKTDNMHIMARQARQRMLNAPLHDMEYYRRTYRESYEEIMYKKVKYMLDNNIDREKPLNMLIDRSYIAMNDDSVAQRHVLSVSKLYLKLLDRYNKEKAENAQNENCDDTLLDESEAKSV